MRPAKAGDDVIVEHQGQFCRAVVKTARPGTVMVYLVDYDQYKEVKAVVKKLPGIFIMTVFNISKYNDVCVQRMSQTEKSQCL